LAKSHIPISDASDVREAAEQKRTDMSRMQTGRMGSEQRGAAAQQEPQKVQPVRFEKRVGRNDPCPCGSGKKFKNCHGIGMAD